MIDENVLCGAGSACPSAAFFTSWLGEMIASRYAHLLADPADRFANGMLVENPFSIE